jgi:biotin carboxylase
MKTIVLIGSGGECVFAIQKAKKLGYYVLSTDKNPDTPGAALADTFLPLDVYNPEETVAGLQRWKEQGGKTDGVLCVAVDAPHTVAAVGAAFNLSAISMETARLATDKLAMKQRLQAHGIPVPWFEVARDVQDVRDAVQEQGYPLVIKPVDSRGARGVLRLTESVDLQWAYAFSQAESMTGRVMVEKFLDGPQVSTEGLMVHGTAHIPGFADRNYEFLERFAPHIIENGGDLPSILPKYAQREIRELTGRAALALGLNHGPVKGDMLWHNGQAYVIEIAARHSGGYFITHEIPWNTGVDLLGASIHMAMGKDPDLEELSPKYQKGVSQRYLFPAPGRVVNITGVEEARGTPNVRYVEVRVTAGDVVAQTASHPARPGVVMAVADNRGLASKTAEQAARTICITTTPFELKKP